MAGYKALAALGRSVVEILNFGFRSERPAPLRCPTAVLAGTADFDQVNSSPSAVIRFPAVSLYCYRISVDRETRPGWSAVAAGDGIPRVPLRMHLMISAWDQVVENELEWLGLTARILEANSLLTGPRLDPSGDWDPGDMVQVVPDELALDSMSEAFQALTTDYRLCLPYVARVIVIDAGATPTAERVTTIGNQVDAIGRQPS
ncbi:uncharacterized protein DUF4255 [Kribbella rubisoli]|uniref:Uncharacterized protein DUF4255 n=1 Tax=Kribbella rubisoli TaxID=3075929 RepID=A0A4V2FWW7_9ACTN|nr:DUF4255 domain-containing protein [Kribbella rubisoli]RZU11366.1 uncharacterized protein DUF4255 [Kribbella rubisoli]